MSTSKRVSLPSDYSIVAERQLRSDKPQIFYELVSSRRSTAHSQSTTFAEMAETAFTSIKPPTFSGKTDEDADAFIKSFDRYVKYREITDADKKRNLLAVLFTHSAGDWYESLPDATKSTFDTLRTAFASRYQSPDTLKFKCAAEIFTKKQGETQSADDYITQMCKLAKLCSADENILKFAVINGLKPYISVQVTQAKPETIDQILEVARLAELTMPKAGLVMSESSVCQQLAEMQAEMRRLSTKVDKAMTATIQPRSPTPDRRVHFARPESPGPRSSSPNDVFSNRYRARDQMKASNDRAFRPVMQRPLHNQQHQTGDYNAQWQPKPNPPTTQCTRCARFHSENAFCPARDPTKLDCFSIV